MIKKTKEFFYVGSVNVKVGSYNDDYFNNAKECLVASAYLLTLFDESPYDDFLEYIQDSIKCNPMTLNYIKDVDFVIENDTIILVLDEIDESFINMGSYSLMDLQSASLTIYISGSYMFIYDLNNKKKYMYFTK